MVLKYMLQYSHLFSIFLVWFSIVAKTLETLKQSNFRIDWFLVYIVHSICTCVKLGGTVLHLPPPNSCK